LLQPLHPLHSVFLAGALTLFVGALLGDLAYGFSYETQWKNFASWLVVGGLSLHAIAAVWSLVDFVRLRHDRGVRRGAYLGLMIAIALLAFGNALVHAGDAWQSMPTGLILSALIVILAMAATWLGFSAFSARIRP
jgi:uncharacterized membrane protein